MSQPPLFYKDRYNIYVHMSTYDGKDVNNVVVEVRVEFPHMIYLSSEVGANIDQSERRQIT
jgi:hypothetical protein